MSVRVVHADALIKRLSEELKKLKELEPPVWARFAKTGAHKERPPDKPDWWYSRAASIVRKLYLEGPVGVSRLRTYYGGRQNRGQAPEHFRKAGGKIIRAIFQQLEKAGLTIKVGRAGRKLSPQGVKLIEDLAGEVKGAK
ncbi:MAG: 30S ribosomal protein S19e [Candidatus Hadarchaeota archaeon]